VKLRPATILHLMRLRESTNAAEAESAHATLARAQVYAFTVPTGNGDVWLLRLLASLGRDVGVVVWQRPASAVVVAPDEHLLLAALWFLATLRAELSAATQSLGGAARDMAAWSLAEAVARRFTLDLERPLITPAPASSVAEEERERLRQGALVGHWIARDVSPLQRSIPRRLPPHVEPYVFSLDSYTFHLSNVSFALTQREADILSGFRLKRPPR